MAHEHHCPNCGPQACNASTSKIHTCGVCAAIWEEDLTLPAPAAAAPRPPAAVAMPAAPPAKPPAAPGSVATDAAGPKPAIPPPPALGPAPVAPPAPKPTLAVPAKPPVPAAGPAKGTKTLAEVVQAAKVRRCPKCVSDSLAAPLDFIEAHGRVVLQDSQTYRAHQWYADTGELYAPQAAPPARAPAVPKPASAAPPSA